MFIVFCLGVIIGLLIRRCQQITPAQLQEIRQSPMKVLGFKGKTQFIEPVSDKEKFDNADNISDILNG